MFLVSFFFADHLTCIRAVICLHNCLGNGCFTFTGRICSLFVQERVPLRFCFSCFLTRHMFLLCLSFDRFWRHVSIGSRALNSVFSYLFSTHVAMFSASAEPRATRTVTAKVCAPKLLWGATICEDTSFWDARCRLPCAIEVIQRWTRSVPAWAGC